MWMISLYTGRNMYIKKIFRNSALFALFALNHQSRPEVFWRHSPLTFYYISIFITSIQYSIQFRGLNWIVNSLRMSKLNWIELNWAQFKVNCLNYREPWPALDQHSYMIQASSGYPQCRHTKLIQCRSPTGGVANIACSIGLLPRWYSLPALFRLQLAMKKPAADHWKDTKQKRKTCCSTIILSTARLSDVEVETRTSF